MTGDSIEEHLDAVESVLSRLTELGPEISQRDYREAYRVVMVSLWRIRDLTGEICNDGGRESTGHKAHRRFKGLLF